MKLLILGATSSIAIATARFYAESHQADMILAGRNHQAIDDLAKDLLVRGAGKVETLIGDLSDDSLHEAMLDDAFEKFQKIDLVLIAYGILGNQEACEQHVGKMKDMMQINAISSLSWLTLLANRMEKQGSGTIAFISSVAGDRGRPSNYVYGASKAVVTTFLQGMRARLAKKGVHVLTIKPGFVDTPMTAEFDKGGPLWVQPEVIAQGIAKAVEKKKNSVYLPWFWRYIMLIIIHIPEFIFKKLNL